MSAEEARLAERWCNRVVVADLDRALPAELASATFDVLLLSHVLEHVADPARTLTALARLLTPRGLAVIAVPNMASYDMRVRFLRGDWRRDELGAMDRTHRQFWSYETAPEMLAGTPLRLVRHEGDPAPMSQLGRFVPRIARWLRGAGAARYPNLLCWQTLLVAEHRGTS